MDDDRNESETSTALLSGPAPLHEQIAARLRESILNHEWPAHFKLPAEPDLAAQYGVSRGTVRRALKSLTEEALLVQVQGKGTFVTSATSTEQPLAQEFLSFDEGLRRQGTPFETELLVQEVTPAPVRVAGLLQVASTLPLLRIVRRRRIHETWALFIETYVRRDLCPGVEEHDFVNRSLFHVLENSYGHRIDWGRRTFEAKGAPGVVAQNLVLPEGAAVLYLEQVSYLENSVPIEYSDVWIRTDTVKVSSLLKRRRRASNGSSPDGQDSVAITELRLRDA